MKSACYSVIILATLLLATTYSAVAQSSSSSSSVASSSSSSVSSDLAKVCPNIKPLGSPIVYGYEATKHIPNAPKASSCALTYSIIGPYSNPRNAYWPKSSLVPLYDSNGVLLSRFIRYSQFGDVYAARFYTPYNPLCLKIAATAKQRTGSPAGYVKISSKDCLKVNNLNKRQGAGWRMIGGRRVPLDND
jgi:hypothetical protein